ncbi:MAG: threonylcarbamoyl-AMP synthase [Lachnospiraceae bacterium]|nr:threonylcarbamoyl-AMP synthase [Lachnospiraceae bacterium]
MITKRVLVNENNIDPGLMKEAGSIIRNGGLVAFPTETVYGLGGDALSSASSKKIYEAKGRPSDNPLIVHISKTEDLDRIVLEKPDAAMELARAFWPGPVTLIFKKNNTVPDETTGGLDTVAVRMPSHRTALAFIEAAGGYIAAPSANRSGRPSPTTADRVMEDMDGRIDMVIDGGLSTIGLESTIVDVTGEVPMILRPGYITAEMVEMITGRVELDPAVFSQNDEKLKPKAPGMKYRHYAPKGELTIVSGEGKKAGGYILKQLTDLKERGIRSGVMVSGDDELLDEYGKNADLVITLGEKKNGEDIARNLYEALREFDDKDIEEIYCFDIPLKGFGTAIMNRLMKAAANKIVRV